MEGPAKSCLRKPYPAVLLVIMLLFLLGAGEGVFAAELTIVATTNIVGDVARQVVGDAGAVVTLMGPGVDPHLYHPTHGDMRRLSQADIIFYNGLHLEGKMGDILVRMARSLPTYAVTEYMGPDDLLETESFAGLYDPHVWMDVKLWIKAVERVRDALAEVDPQRAALYQRRAQAYIEELERLHGWVHQQVASLPPERRVLVTAHDAFAYFGRAYQVEVVGLQGISTDTEVGLADISRMVSLLVERQIPAVFVETSVSTRGMEAVMQGAAARGHHVRLGGELYSDALGAPDTPQGTYVGMIRHNVTTIVEALR